MNLNTNAAKMVAALVVLNAGLFASHSLPTITAPGRAIQAQLVSARTEICKARTEARMAALDARLQARAARREALRTRRQVQQDMKRAATMAPTSTNGKTRTSISDYVHCLVTSGVRTVVSGI